MIFGINYSWPDTCTYRFTIKGQYYHITRTVWITSSILKRWIFCEWGSTGSRIMGRSSPVGAGVGNRSKMPTWHKTFLYKQKKQKSFSYSVDWRWKCRLILTQKIFIKQKEIRNIFRRIRTEEKVPPRSAPVSDLLNLTRNILEIRIKSQSSINCKDGLAPKRLHYFWHGYV